MPQRIQRKRIKGWKMPPNTVYVGRNTFWGNPFAIGWHVLIQSPADVVDRRGVRIMGGMGQIENETQAVAWYRAYSEHWTTTSQARAQKELRGKNLACWCPLDKPCHADVLLELANGKQRDPLANVSTLELTNMAKKFPFTAERQMYEILMAFLAMRRVGDAPPSKN